MIEYFLPSIILIGLLTSYEDIKERKIKNKYILVGLGLGLFTHLALLLFQVISIKYLAIAGISLVFMTILTFAGWNFGFWSAGDAKLLIVMSFLTPLTVYRYTTTIFPHLEIILNTIILLFIYVAAGLIFTTSKKEKKETIKEMLNWKRIVLMMIVVLGTSWISRILLALINMKNNYLIRILLMMGIYKLGERFLKDKTLFAFMFIALIRVIVEYKIIFTINFVIGYVTRLLVFMLTLGALKKMSTKRTIRVRLSELQEGMILAEIFDEKGKRKDLSKKKESLPLTSELNMELDSQKIKELQEKWSRHAKTIRVYETIPSAIFITTATILTILLKGNLVMFIIQLL